MSETPTTTTSEKSIAICLQFVLQYTSNLYCSAFGTLSPGEGEKIQYSSHLYRSAPPICVSQYASHLYRSMPPICIAMLWGKSWWLWSPECSPSFKRTKLTPIAEMPCYTVAYTRGCREKSLANGDAQFWCTQVQSFLHIICLMMW